MWLGFTAQKSGSQPGLRPRFAEGRLQALLGAASIPSSAPMAAVPSCPHLPSLPWDLSTSSSAPQEQGDIHRAEPTPQSPSPPTT